MDQKEWGEEGCMTTIFLPARDVRTGTLPAMTIVQNMHIGRQSFRG